MNVLVSIKQISFSPRYTSASREPILPLKLRLVAEMPTSPACSSPVPKLKPSISFDMKLLARVPDARSASRRKWNGTGFQEGLPISSLSAGCFYLRRSCSNIQADAGCHLLALIFGFNEEGYEGDFRYLKDFGSTGEVSDATIDARDDIGLVDFELAFAHLLYTRHNLDVVWSAI